MEKQTTQNDLARQIIFIAALAFCFTPWSSPPLGLLLGIILSQLIGHPFLKHNHRATKILLQVSVVGLGFGMNLYEAAKVGREGFVFTISSICITLLAGILIGRLLKIDKKITLLISSGTAICGGSAIAAVSPVIDAGEDQMSVSLGTVFILNSIALFLFPVIGHYFNFSQSQFGLWAAIAIHDTSSVVGAAQRYGADALEIATTVKLERALWIIPLTLGVALIFKNKSGKIKLPYFIFLFIVAMAIHTYIPQFNPVDQVILWIAKKGLTATLFLIGAGLTRSTLKTVGFKPLILGVIVWTIISVGSFLVIQGTVK